MLGFLRTDAGPLCEGRANKREMAVLAKFGKQMAVCTWDFSVDGGAVGTYLFRTQLPANSVITNVWTDEITAVTGATDVTLKAGSTALTGSIDFTGDAGVNSRALAGAATGIKVAAASELQIAIATAAATAGKVRFAVEFYLSDGP